MDRAPRFPYELLLFAIFLLGIFGYRYYEYVISRNFLLDVSTACDPATEQCFVSDCSPEDDPGCPPGPYKKIEIRDADAPRCLEEHQCTDFSCDGIDSCTTTYCSEDALDDGESCVNDLHTDSSTTTPDRSS